MSERMRDLRWPLVTAIVVVAAMLAVFAVTRSDAATPPAPNGTPVQAESTPAPGERDHDGRDCPKHGGGGGSAPQGTAPAPSSSGTEL